jgi:hypothetical protein
MIGLFVFPFAFKIRILIFVHCTLHNKNQLSFHIFFLLARYFSSDSSVFNVIKKTRIPVIMIKESYGVQLREVLHR